MAETIITHATTNAGSPIYDGFGTYAPPFNPGIKPDVVMLLGDAPSAILFENSTLKVTDTLGRLRRFRLRRIEAESVEVLSPIAATARVVTHSVVADPNFTGGKISLVIREFEGGRYDQAPHIMPYYTVVPAGTSDAVIIQGIVDRINRDPQAYVTAALVVAAGGQPDKIQITSKTPGRWFESVPGRRLSKETQVTASQHEAMTGPFLESINAELDPALYASGKQYQGIAFRFEETIPFAGAGLFRQGRSENNSKELVERTAWLIADLTNATGKAALNTAIGVLNGTATPTNKYDTIGGTSGAIPPFA